MDDCSHFTSAEEKESLINDEAPKKPEEILHEMKRIAELIQNVSTCNLFLLLLNRELLIS